MPAKEEFEKLWPHAIIPPNMKEMLWTWFRNGWDARDLAAQQLAEAAPNRWESVVVKPALIGRILEAAPEISALQAERIARKLLEDGAA